MMANEDIKDVMGSEDPVLRASAYFHGKRDVGFMVVELDGDYTLCVASRKGLEESDDISEAMEPIAYFPDRRSYIAFERTLRNLMGSEWSVIKEGEEAEAPAEELFERL